MQLETKKRGQKSLKNLLLALMKTETRSLQHLVGWVRMDLQL